MAVFTPVELSDITAWISQNFKIGEATKIRGIHGGIENSNFFLDTVKDGKKQEYVLTIFERLSAEQLPYYLELMRHLANKGVPVPKPIENNQGEILFSLKGKPAAIVSKLPGLSRMQPEAKHCAMVGEMLAKMHLAGKDFPKSQENLRSLSWWQETIPLVLPHLNSAQKDLLTHELATQEAFFTSSNYDMLPQGASHCDLFRDNVLFDSQGSTDTSKDQLGGFFDFYFAGTDKWLFDLAVTVNDWCLAENKQDLDPVRFDALMQAYQSVRPLSKEEQASWPLMVRAAALRFWVSRLWDFYLPRDAQMLTPHDPTHFESILLSRRSL
ncbi:homoserine kinase [Polynucleobacter wuianus]|uniref:Homoserine kinase n=1 Tax=Polynucleobacter wuianus TaxID=1743168 RepID=A0A191UGZ5_9BURK|nr:MULTISPECIES: homoserine kinase [Polynucleobacter]ANJ00294.1 homoserine kinase [Polynucleobacter wuianus]MBU3553647.1 homoserine kinase [Polynucleobacter sp. MWH-Post4-6-1]MBU3610883.1 homoserine kinase [Polynucleobacter wuianus]